MAWTRLDDQFFANPKVIDLSKDAKLLYLSAVTYSAGQLTDGRIGPGALRTVSALVDADRACAAELVACGLWEIDGDDYLIHDYLEYNPTAAEVRAKRAADRARKRPVSNEGTDANSGGNPNGIAVDSHPPVPTPVPVPKPVPKPEPKRESGRAAARVAPEDSPHGFCLVFLELMGQTEDDVAPLWFEENRKHAKTMLEQGVNVDKLRRYVRYEQAKGKTDFKLRYVVKDLLDWEANGEPESVTPRGSPRLTPDEQRRQHNKTVLLEHYDARKAASHD